MSEEWKVIEEFPDYEVSNLGRVMSHKSHRILKGSRDDDGYPFVELSRSGRTKQIKTHVLVLTAFSGPRPLGMVSGHVDGSKSNNVIRNLSWITPKKNAEDRWDHGTMLDGERSHYSKLTDAHRSEIRARHIRGSSRTGNTTALSKEFGVTRKTIQNIVNMPPGPGYIEIRKRKHT